MSITSDISFTLSGKTLRDKLTLKERAKLLCEILADIDCDTYYKTDENGHWIGDDVEKAMEDLQKIEQQAIEYEGRYPTTTSTKPIER